MTARWRIAVLAVLVVAVAVGTTFVLTRPSFDGVLRIPTMQSRTSSMVGVTSAAACRGGAPTPWTRVGKR